MSLSSTTSRVSYAGDGSTTVFPFGYYFLDQADLIVVLRVTATLVDTTKVITTDYTVSGAGASAGGSVTMLTAPAVGETLTIYRDNVKTQDLDLVENDPLPAEEVEKRFDKAMMIDQRLGDRLDRAMRLAEGASAAGLSLYLPIPLASAYLRWNASANGFENASIDATTLQQLQTITGSRAVPTLIVAANGITPAAGAFFETQFIAGSGGAADISKNPQIAAGSSLGQRLLLIGTHDTNTVTLEDGAGLKLNGSWVGANYWSIELMWDLTNWCEITRSERT